MSIDDKLSKIKYICDDVSHLTIDQEKCKNCKVKACTFICPANVWNWDDKKDKMIINYENCLECGACRIACKKENIEWNYPKGNKGVIFKNG